MIIATACLPVLRQQRAGEPLVFVAREVMRPLLEEHPLLDGFIALPQEAGRLTAAFREQHAATLVHLHPDKVCQFAGWRAGIPERVGYRSSGWIDWTLSRSRADARRDSQQHEAQHNFALLTELGIESPPLAELRPSVHLGERWQTSLRSKLTAAGYGAPGRYVVLNPTAHSLTHRWPVENFAWLAEQLGPHCDRFILIGEPAGDLSVKSLRLLLENLSGHSVDLSGQLNLAELGWLLREAALLVSRNTGTTHLAAAVGCPTVELFGRLEPIYGPTRWRALGERVREVNAPATSKRRFETKQAYWRRRFAAIPREPVLAAALDLLTADR